MMNNYGCNCRPTCTGIAVRISAIIGIIAAFLSFTAIITVTPAFLWVLFGVSVGYLAIAGIITAFQGCSIPCGCKCKAINALLFGILGTVLTSVILLAITFAATSIIGTILVGALLFFFSLVITSTACLVRCLSGCDEN